MSTASLAVPAVVQPDGPVAELGAGDQVEPVVLVDVVERPGTFARNVRVQVQAELIDQVEPHERPPEANSAPDDDVAVAASPELVDLFCRVTHGDGGVGPLGGPQSPGEDDLARGVHDAGERVVGRRQGSGHGLVGGAAHDVRVRALVNVDLLLQGRGSTGRPKQNSQYSVPSSARRPSSEYMNTHAISFRMIRTPWSRVVRRPCLL